MYWSDFAGKRIRLCNLDGTGVETIISLINSPYGLAVLRRRSREVKTLLRKRRKR